MTPSEMMDQQLEQANVSKGWVFWDLEPPTIDDEEASRIPVRTVSKQPRRFDDEAAQQLMLNLETARQEALEAIRRAWKHRLDS